MKNYFSSIYSLLFTSLFFLLPLITNAQGTVCNNDQAITLSTQAQVDNFATDYPNCNRVHSLHISGANITNLDGLSNINTISNTLFIQNANNLTDISGLSNLTTIGGALLIEECSQITNLDAFLNLTSMISELRIRLNNNLTSIAGLSNVPLIRVIRIAGNPKLAECCSIYHLITHPNVEIIVMNGNAGNCTENGIKADPASATIEVVKNGGVIEGGVICEGVAVQLRASNIFKYQWADHPSLSATDISNPTIMPTETTTYSVTITGCNEQVATKSITVTPLDIDRVYVNPDATGNNDGTTWEHAFTELQPAINRACDGTEIWVAAGTYSPTEIPYDAHNGNGRLKTFHLSKNVRLYGGFAGTETQLSERNPAANKTILDANNAYHALIMINLSANAIVDGLTIQNGNGNGNASFTSVYAGGGFFHSNVGGVFMRSSDVQINNCIFKNNRGDAASAIIIQSNANPTLTNCLFFDNPQGAAIYSFRSASPKIINCTITDNQIGVLNRAVDASDNTAPAYTNTIIYNNATNVTTTAFSEPTFKNCLVEDSGGSSNWSLTGATDLGGNIDADPLFVDATNDDYSLKICSPALNVGNNAANTTTTDLANNPRIFDAGNSSVVDLGVYELQQALPLAGAIQVTESGCSNLGDTPQGGSFAPPAMDCPTGFTLQYSVNNGTWTTTLPTYDSENSLTVRTRCSCDNNPSRAGEINTVVTQPGTGIICPVAVAGVNQVACGSRFKLRALTPASGTGRWTFVDNPNDDGILTNPESPDAVLSTEFPYVNNFSESFFETTDFVRSYTLRWTVTGEGDCTESNDEVTITLMGLPDFESIAFNQCNVCGTSTKLITSLNTKGPGVWTFVSDPDGATISNPNQPDSELIGTIGGIYLLNYTITEGQYAGMEENIGLSFSPDIDLRDGRGDGTQDCLDLCIGGDDRNNADGIGIPDDCDCNPTEEENEFVDMDNDATLDFLADQQTAAQPTRQADFRLTSDADIPNIGKNIVFKAGNQVTLTAGFQTAPGAQFTATVDYCNDPLGYDNSLCQPEPLRYDPLQQTTESVPTKLDLKIIPTVVNNTAQVTIETETKQPFSLVLYNLNGQQIEVYISQTAYNSGVHLQEINTANLDNGIYFLRLSSQRDLITRKLIVQHY